MLINQTTGHPIGRARGYDGLAEVLRAAVLRMVERLEGWAARAEQRRQLAALDARMLRDIGRSQADALRESAKPFWRE